jgi:hypothetical protein
MKKIIITLCACFLVSGVWAQLDDGATVVMASQTVQRLETTTTTDTTAYLQFQMGIPFITSSGRERDIRFPWGVLYLYETFADESFDVSKGYFGDKVIISWNIRKNIDIITNLKLYRREYNAGQGPWSETDFIKNISKTATATEDTYIQGGILYEYKLAAAGINDNEALYKTYITGIGFRNPTAIVTGNVSFKGGNPVKDVVIKASSTDAVTSFGSALEIPSAGQLEVIGLTKNITNEATFQAWLKPKTAYTGNTGPAIRLFSLQSFAQAEKAINVTVNLLAESKALQVTIGGSVYKLNNYYPSGVLNARGDDVLVKVSDFNTNFVHFSVIIKEGQVPSLFINGREISAQYSADTHAKLVGVDPNYTAPFFDVEIPTLTNSLALSGAYKWDNIYFGGGAAAFVDEMRVWKTGLDKVRIKRDYSRYISGNNINLISYLSANEGVGAFAYDLSRNGFTYNKNNGKLGTTKWVAGSGNIPADNQLGILGVTDINGNYEITSIPYSGTGESFTITPLYGNHQFEPSQQLVFLGQGSEVVNKITFEDKSSFSFKGKVLYDTRGVFKSFVEVNSGNSSTPVFNNLTDGDEYISGPGILDEGYNYYQKGNEKFDKGEYWLNDNGTPYDGEDASLKENDYLERYAKIFSEGVNIYIDGNIVLDDNNTPVVTDVEGEFDISVPIGNHYITLKKDGHQFAYNSRFPEASGTFEEFFEDANEAVVFIDETRVTVVGRVVGGSVQSQKVIGFGENGLVEKSITDANEVEKTIAISSKNNIGVAAMTLGYKPPGSEVTPYTKTNFETNSESGEYRVSLLPLDYKLKASDLIISEGYKNLRILNADTEEPFNFSKAVASIIPSYENEDGSIETGFPYHYVKSFTYRSTPVLKVVEQTSDKFVTVDGVNISIQERSNLKMYSQFAPYKLVLNRFERYLNYDTNNDPIEDLIPVIDGELVINNNLVLANSETIEVDPDDGSILTYTFKAGLPNISPPFKLSSSLQYRIDGKNYPVEDYIKDGVIFGGQSDGSQTFVTAAPDIPDIILRDPPGSNSFASIEKGTSITLTTESSAATTVGVTNNTKIYGGVKFAVGGGLAGPVVETETTSSIDIGIGLSTSSKDGKSLSKTYAFSQTISTSDDPDFVGSEGDLYIGNSKNQFYGSFNNVQASLKAEGDYNYENSIITNGGFVVDISVQKAVYFVEEPSETFFVFSQKHILSTLIPEYELFIKNIDNGQLTPGENGTLTVEEYEEQIRLWRKVILDNEKSKYLAKNDREKYKTSLTNVISNFNSEIETAISGSYNPAGELQLRSKLAQSTMIKDLLNTKFDDNISFDAGVGEFTRSVETIVVANKSNEYNLKIDESIAGELGLQVNTAGFVNTTNGFFQQDVNTSLSQEVQTTTKISYTLKDNDPANVLSVDVVNSFDGYGPIFITQGGRTSCPYEGPEESKFYPQANYEEYFKKYFANQSDIVASNVAIITNEQDYNELRMDAFGAVTVDNRDERVLLEVERQRLVDAKALLELDFSTAVDCCPDDTKAQLSFATQKVEVPLLSVKIADISNVPESKNAEFTLLLQNSSASETDATFLLKIDNTTNPDNVLTNIEADGTLVNVPYGETTTYKMTLGKSISDVFDYKNIRVVLQSVCDGEAVSDDVFLSASFVPSCSDVIVSAPINNWTYNKEEALNADGSTKPLVIKMTGFNASFASFKKIDLEYRSATSPNWSRLQTYYGNQAFYDVAVKNGEDEISLISTSSISYPLDISKLNIQDGNYEIRARSICSNDTEFISEVITGRVDLNAPQKFGTPLPTDGILSAGEDLRVRFNENIFFNSAVSTIEIKGQTNQLPINNNVSLYFEGPNNTVSIEKPRIVTGDFSLEFWMNNATVAGSATVFSQTNGINIGLVGEQMSAAIGGINVTGIIASDNLFHHYTITHNNETGSLSIYEDDTEIGDTAEGAANAQFTNSNSLVIGGNSFIGNIHDLRLWSKSLTLANAFANIYTKIIGNENGLLGYWPMDEGRGTIAKDLAFFKHGIVNASWDIKPKGSSYEFANGQYLELDKLASAQLSSSMDATLSFWIKTATAQDATIFSNGKGDGTDTVPSSGLSNKWAINISSAGTLSLDSEGSSYGLTTKSIADDSWHHVTLLFNRLGSLRTYVDAEQVSSNSTTDIGGFSGDQAWLGARGPIDGGVGPVDRVFTGKIDEFRLWNSLRNVDQISRDRFNEIDIESIGLLLYARMNAPTEAGPRYYASSGNGSAIPYDAVVSSGDDNYSNDVPAIKPERSLSKFSVNRVINEDEMIIEPVVTDWASLEGQVLDITVNRMFDDANNMQQSPITWTAYVKRNELSWYADGFNEIVDLVNYKGDKKTLEITLVNSSGVAQPYAITSVPSWMQLSSSSGVLSPDSKKIITATIDKELPANVYNEILFLESDFGFNLKLPVNLRVLEEEPNWAVSPNDYSYSTNVVGRIKVDGIFSNDMYDMIGAFYNDEVRGVTNLVYDPSYGQYYIYLTIYSNEASGEDIEFRIWDASKGKILQSTVNKAISMKFQTNAILGNLVDPALFENTNAVEQDLSLNKGWTWVSFNVNDTNFSNLNTLTNNLVLETDDRILSNAPSQLETYTENFGWDGQISNQGGLSIDKMFKVYLANAQSLKIKGLPVDLGVWDFPITIDWNWLPFNLPANRLLKEAMATYQATDGDVIKSQNLFAIYDKRNGWIGSLDYLEEGKGYMLKSGIDQLFTYPQNFGKASSVKGGKTLQDYEQPEIAPDFTKYSNNMNAVVLLPEGYDELLVLDMDKTVKGISKADNYSNKKLSFITIYGDLPEELVFHVRNGSDMKPTTKTFVFNSNDVLGSFDKPIDLREKISGTKLYPNPFSNTFSVELDVAENQTAVVKLYSINGQLMYEQDFNVTKGFNKISVAPRVSKGVYMIYVVTNKNISINKIIKN